MKILKVELKPQYELHIDLFCKSANENVAGVHVVSDSDSINIEYDTEEQLFAVAKHYGQFTVLVDVSNARELKQTIKNVKP